jgi:heme-degrading monooxygenase HmoA
MGEHFASGNWHVTKGKEKEFVAAWTEFLQWTRKTQPGMTRAMLTRDTADTRHFQSVSEWEDTKSRDAWKQSTDFKKYFGAARALCDEMSSADYELNVTI